MERSGPAEPDDALIEHARGLRRLSSQLVRTSRSQREAARGVVDQARRIRSCQRGGPTPEGICRAAILGAVRRLKGQLAQLQERSDRVPGGEPAPLTGSYLTRINSQLDRILIEERELGGRL